jgi:CubicO group peptidase (beta-lactamase class C family)
MIGTRKSALAGLVLFLATGALALAGLERTEDLAGRLDRIFAEAYPAMGPGAAVIVVQDGKPVLRKGYGLANVELSVAIAPEMVFRIGSVTKQFTAAAILKLAEAGKLSLSDEIGRFLPDYPTRGKRITVEQLLNHTSGIKSLTGMPSWPSHTREDWTPGQLIAFFQNEPLDFEPGTGWKYNNSGYILLGAIIEKVSGKKYEDFLAEAIFRPLGMERTRYGGDRPIIAGRVEGYQRTPAGIVNAPYLSMTLPFSAGALVSTVDDLARWQAALDGDGFLSADSRRRMWTAVTLPDGTATRYGFGWGIWSYEGHAVVEHGGSINGFVSANMRWPDDRVYVAVLSNATGPGRDPRMLALRAASIVAGIPADDRKAVTLPPAMLELYAGAYTDSDGDNWLVRRKGNHLEVEAGPSSSEVFASPACADCFFYRDHVRDIRFEKSPAGAVVALLIDEHIGPIERAVRALGKSRGAG